MPGPLLQVEATPNPNALRILTARQIWSGAPIEVRLGEPCEDVPLARELLALDGLARVMIGPDFVTIMRGSAEQAWYGLKAEAIATIANFLLSGRVAVERQACCDQCGRDEEDPVSSQIAEVLERFVRPMLARDGGEATLLAFEAESGIARIRMSGACGGCPSGRTTLKRAIEQTVMRYVPEVRRVEADADGNAAEDSRARFRDWVKSKWGLGRSS
jgi:Fe-S cluster biogenesis protein NfuA